MITKEIILSKRDYEIISGFVRNRSFGASDASLKKLASELRTAKVVEKEKMPKHTVQLNSEVKIAVDGTKTEMLVKLVIPSEADIKQKKISIFAPLGSALIGYQKGDKISWDVPAGTKTFTILEVSND